MERWQIQSEIRKAVADAMHERAMMEMGMAQGADAGVDLGNRELRPGVMARGEDGYPWGSTRWLWGVSVAGAVVTVGAGALRRAGSIYESVAASVTITTDGYWIGWEFDPSNNTLIVIATEQATMPADSDGLMRGPLYKVSFADGVVTGVVPWQCGIIVTNLYGE